jgi:hypothetical protein
MEFEQSGTGNEEYEHENEVREPLDLSKFHVMPPSQSLFVFNNPTIRSGEIQNRRPLP